MTLATEVLADSPWGFWRFADLTDSSGNGHDLGLYRGTPSYGLASYLPGDPDGHAAGFDGTNGWGWPGTPSTDLTVEYWLRVGCCDNATVGGNYPAYRFGTSGDWGAPYNTLPWVASDSGPRQWPGDHSPNLCVGGPYHICMVWTGQVSCEIFLNGNSLGTVSADRGGGGGGGSLGYYGSSGWSDQIQGLAVYLTALSPTRIMAHYTAGVTAGTTYSGSASGASSSSGDASGWVGLTASASGASTSAGRAHGGIGYPDSASGASASAGQAAATLHHPLLATASGQDSVSAGRAGGRVQSPFVFGTIRPYPLGQGSYNGITWGPGQQLQVVKHEGLEQTPKLRTEDQNRANRHGAYEPSRDLYEPRTVTLTFAVLGTDNTNLRQLLYWLERTWEPDSIDRPLMLFDSNRRLTARVRNRQFDHYVGGRASVSTGTVEWFAFDPFYYEPTSVVSLAPNVPQSLINSGDLDIPFQVTIAGPVTNPSITHVELGASLWFNVQLDVGETLVINTDLPSVLVNGQPGASYRDPLSRWFDLLVGGNTILYSSDSNRSDEQAVCTWASPRV